MHNFAIVQATDCCFGIRELMNIQPRKLIVEVDEGRCIGVGYCVDCAAAVFRLNSRRVAEVIDSNGADETAILEAAMNCPVDAIFVETEDGELLWPR